VKWQPENQLLMAVIAFRHFNPFFKIGISEDDSDLIYRIAV